MNKIKTAIIGAGNIGTDLMVKIIRTSNLLELAIVVSINPNSKGLERARRFGISTSHEGVEGLIASDLFKDIKIIFDATSAKAHLYNYDKIKVFSNKYVVDLTPASIGPHIVPAVNFDEVSSHKNLNMITCSGQATIPMVAAVSQVSEVYHAEINSTISDKSIGPATKSNMAESEKATIEAIQKIGKAKKAKVSFFSNSTEPPIIMTNIIILIGKDTSRKNIKQSIDKMIKKVQEYVPGYRLYQAIQFEEISKNNPHKLESVDLVDGLKTTIFVKVKGAGHYLPEYAGNLDIITSAGLSTAEKIAETNFNI